VSAKFEPLQVTKLLYFHIHSTSIVVLDTIVAVVEVQEKEKVEEEDIENCREVLTV